ncbi:MAG: hypothetical protein GY774_36765 [Planctomycetes bacterium]|nr:hypothetical protein [Planctomycetota bacterium]
MKFKTHGRIAAKKILKVSTMACSTMVITDQGTRCKLHPKGPKDHNTSAVKSRFFDEYGSQSISDVIFGLSRSRRVFFIYRKVI